MYQPLYLRDLPQTPHFNLPRCSTNGVILVAIEKLLKAIYLKNKVPSSLYFAFYSMDLSETPNL